MKRTPYGAEYETMKGSLKPASYACGQSHPESHGEDKKRRKPNVDARADHPRVQFRWTAKIVARYN